MLIWLLLVSYMVAGGALPTTLGRLQSLGTHHRIPRSLATELTCIDAPSDSSDTPFETAPVQTQGLSPRLSALKQELLSTSASCDRGFGASNADRVRVNRLLDELIALNAPQNPTANLFPYNSDSASVAPLEGVWRMVYTDAYDVLSLAASPVTLLQGIYQVIESSGRSVNIIDLTSRLVPLLPVSLAKSLESVLRLKVITESQARSATRVGLRFQAIKIQPLTLLGQDVENALPPLSASLPQKFLYQAADSIAEMFTPGGGSASGTDGLNNALNESLGFFDVAYLDEDMLVIRQNQPGGLFISSRLADADTAKYF